ncbi:MAG TPA: PQQ-dependent sugar dehydrogenase [Actinomycetota bacterium]|nr:PQQ-dependent sugar dehydrogenase [Actinomycetota bacterium]
MNLSAKAPADNPFPNKRIYSFGHRNMFGLAFDPQGGGLWISENGPECNDEVNLIVAGGNYAWGQHETCAGTAPGNTNQDGPQPRLLPEVFYVSTIAPTGAEFCNGCGLAGQSGHLLFGANNDGKIRSLTLDAGRDDVASQSVAYDHPSAVISMIAAPNGQIYFSDPSGIWRLTP